MKKLFMISLAAIISFQMPGCRTQQKTTGGEKVEHHYVVIGDNSATSLDWAGTYTGTLPCADCEGIITTIVLKDDLTYTRNMLYKGRGGNPFSDSGKFSWDKQGRSILLEGENSGSDRFLVGENMLAMLDREGNRITGELAGNYILVKKTTGPADVKLINKKWKLSELNGQPIALETENVTGIFIVFDHAGQSIHGFGGCNQFFGNYEILDGNRISFSKIGATRMSCPDLETEQSFFEMLEAADNYVADEKSLQLNRARMAPLARFELITE